MKTIHTKEDFNWSGGAKVWVYKMYTLQVLPIQIVRDRSCRERTNNMGDDDAWNMKLFAWATQWRHVNDVIAWDKLECERVAISETLVTCCEWGKWTLARCSETNEVDESELSRVRAVIERPLGEVTETWHFIRRVLGFRTVTVFEDTGVKGLSGVRRHCRWGKSQCEEGSDLYCLTKCLVWGSWDTSGLSLLSPSCDHEEQSYTWHKKRAGVSQSYKEDKIHLLIERC